MRGDSTRGQRGQSNPLAVALILTLVLVSTVVVVGVGTLTLEEGQRYTESQRGEHAVSKLDQQVSVVGLNGAGAQTLDLAPNGEASVVVRERGWMRLELVNTTNNATTVLTNRTLGVVVHRSGEQRVAFQAGGVWRRRGNASVMVSPPEFHYNGQTLTLPLVAVLGEEHDLSTTVLRDGNRTAVYPNATLHNPVPEDRELVVTVKSRYYRGWHSFFETRVGGDVYYPNGTSSQAAVRFRSADDGTRQLTAGLTSVGTSDRVELKGAGNSPSYIDSYNSAIDTYANRSTDNGTASTSTGLKLSGGSYINGTGSIEGQVRLDSSFVNGDLWHRGLTKIGSSHVTGANASNGTGVDVSHIDPLVDSRVEAIEANNTNNRACVDSDGDLDACGSTIEFEAGRYYVGEDLVVKPSETVVFDLQGGNVTLALDGDLEVKGEVKVVNGSGTDRVKVWLRGDTVKLNDGEVTVPGDRSFRFQLLAPSYTDGEFRANSRFVGVYYAPSKAGSSGTLVMKSSDVYGAAVTGEVEMNSGSSIHHDRNLVGRNIVEADVTTAAELSYLHVSVNEVHVEATG